MHDRVHNKLPMTFFSFLIKETTKFGKLSSPPRWSVGYVLSLGRSSESMGTGRPHHACAGSGSILYPYAVRLRLKPGSYYRCGKFVVIG